MESCHSRVWPAQLSSHSQHSSHGLQPQLECTTSIRFSRGRRLACKSTNNMSKLDCVPSRADKLRAWRPSAGLLAAPLCDVRLSDPIQYGQGGARRVASRRRAAPQHSTGGQRPPAPVECWPPPVRPRPFLARDESARGECAKNQLSHHRCRWSRLRSRPPPPVSTSLRASFQFRSVHRAREACKWPNLVSSGAIIGHYVRPTGCDLQSAPACAHDD